MLFNSLQFFIFLPAVLLLFWLSPFRWRVPILLLASYGFYMAWRPIYVLLILGLTVVNYWLGFKIADSKLHRKAWMVTAITANLVTLSFFKYFYFLEDAFNFIAAPLTGTTVKLPLNIILPLGISFFVFEFIHYTVDVYRGAKPVKNFLAFALFPSFFPTQIAGPIKRFQDFVPQLDVRTPFTREHFDEGCFLILNGLFKKVLLADNLSLFVTGGFAQPQLFTAIDAWLLGWAFSFQVFFDFSGYADIARGAALLFGYKVPINFNFPFLSGSITELWQRWHITLGTWLRDYLYFPMGGSRCGRWRSGFNLLATMTLCGLWHGAGLQYVAFGTFHGLLLVGHREFRFLRETYPNLFRFLDTRLGHAFSVLLTFNLFSVGSAIFRSTNIGESLSIVRKMFFLDGFAPVAGHPYSAVAGINYPLVIQSIFLILPVYFVGQIVIKQALKLPVAHSRALRVAYGAIVIFAVVAFAPDSSPRFIYYQF